MATLISPGLAYSHKENRYSGSAILVAHAGSCMRLNTPAKSGDIEKTLARQLPQLK